MPIESEQLEIPLEGVSLKGDLRLPAGAESLVIFAHGGGSNRLSARNRYLASVLNEAGLATLLFDFLTPTEEERDRATRELRFDLPLLSWRLGEVTQWVLAHSAPENLTAAYFGACTGSAAALMACAGHPGPVHAIVSRGGRPDLAGQALEQVTVPTLLIVGEDDPQVRQWNEQALGRLGSPEKRLEVIARANHRFAEPAALEQVAVLARSWFKFHLGALGQESLKAG